MKKVVFAFLLAVALPFASFAQNRVGSFSIIPKAGVSIANISGSEVLYFDGVGERTMKSKFNPRITAGVDVEYRVHDYLGIVLGAAYSQQGCRFSNHESKTTGFSDMVEKMDYINVPLMLRGYIGQGFSVSAGLQMGVLLSDKISYKASDITKDKDGNLVYSEEVKTEQDSKWLRRNTDFSIPVGISYEYKNVIIDARYKFGLSNLWKDDSFKTEKNKVFDFTVGYRFEL
ncbi:MAG: PorT family protein [Desulfovibrio sp.]|nr:PorT family protein [Desulfovibrio sp.]